MGIPVEKITEAALSLSSDARALLADRLAESLDPLMDSETGEVWAGEALRRLGEIRDGRVETIPGAEALARVRDSLKG